MRSNYFLDIDAKTACDPSAPYVAFPLPYEKTVSFGTGTGKGPEAILRASREIEDFDEELRQRIDIRVQTIDPPDFSSGNIETCLSAIRNTAHHIFEAGRFPVSLGGEHTVTWPLVQAALNSYPDLTVLQIDAHADLRDTYKNISASHACVMRRIEELGIPIVHVGIRSLSCEENLYIEKNNKLNTILAAREFNEQDRKKPLQKLAKILSRSQAVYITLDIDAIDPAIAPGTGTPEPGGLSWEDIIAVLRQTFSSKKVIGADIVETAPIPYSVVTEYVAARIALKMMLYHQLGKLPER